MTIEQEAYAAGQTAAADLLDREADAYEAQFARGSSGHRTAAVIRYAAGLVRESAAAPLRTNG